MMKADPDEKNICLRGIPVSAGIAIGELLVIEKHEKSDHSVRITDTDGEKKRLREAVDIFCSKTKSMAERLRLNVGNNEAAILETQIVMLMDRSMTGAMEEVIESGFCAEHAVDEICGQFVRMFENIDNGVIRARISDIMDIRSRLFSILTGRKEFDIEGIKPGTVLVTRDLTPSMASRIIKGTVAGIITGTGSRTSHSAILARAFGLPAVFGVDNVTGILNSPDTVIVDGNEGLLIYRPDASVMEEYLGKLEREALYGMTLAGLADRPAETKDGKRIQVFCNAGLAADIAPAAAAGAEGIGLFRTELYFMEREAAPPEEEQFLFYRQILESMGEKEVVIRTLDVGGEKNIPYLRMNREDNPYLGYRGIRYSLGHMSEYRKQLRALLRASAYGKLGIMIPMITCVEELTQVVKEIENIKRDFREKGIGFDEDVKVGVMIETPAAALIADTLASECDFFSIGTNDLVQYTMCVDRGNPGVGYLYSVLQPAVLRLIRGVIAAANAMDIPVCMCGEAAADPLMIPLLIAFGLDIFSVSPRNVLNVKNEIAKWSVGEAALTAAKVMELDTLEEIVGYLKVTIQSQFHP